MRFLKSLLLVGLFFGLASCEAPTESDTPPHIVLIYTDDLGYGDLSSYGATAISTPHIDRLAAEGLRFSNAYAPSATCTPSRYALLTGQYAWRKEGTGIARGDAAMVIDPQTPTMADMLKGAGYRTAVIGKWHLGLGGEGGPDWNGAIEPGPLDLGFDEAFLIPATGDRVPTVYIQDRHVVGLDPDDPIEVSFSGPVDDEPIGRTHPELLKMHPSHGHDMTIVNGISRIGYMKGGEAARWVDEDMADVITEKAVAFIEQNQATPFFLYYSTHDIHVPRVAHQRFTGASGMGPRGDVILQLDWAVGEILNALDRLGLAENTLVLFTSDNGPVVDDGYEDQAVELLGSHTPSGPFRGGKYSAFEAGTRVPFLVRWPAHVKQGESRALTSQVDLYASLASLVGAELGEADAPDSFDQIDAMLGKTQDGREYLIAHNSAGTLSIIKDGWKYIEPSEASPYNANTDIELGNAPEPQLYHLVEDIAEQNNLVGQAPENQEALSSLLDMVRTQGRSRP